MKTPLRVHLHDWFPVLRWARGYGRAHFTGDVTAAAIVTLLLIPQSLAYALLADRMIAALQAAVSEDLARSHGEVPGGEAVVIAMGKLGGREMTATSDLDLIVIYDFDTLAQQSDGERPLAPSQFYSRFTQRLITALSAPTAEGTLYEVDMRLRPSGQKGPVATHLDSFIEYQAKEAWTWEHLALTRARVVSGPPGLAAKVEAAINATLVLPRPREDHRRRTRHARSHRG